MWRLLRASLQRWWWRPLAVAVIVACIVGAWETVYQGRGMGDWNAVYPWMLGFAGATAFFFSKFECRRDAFFKCLPHTTFEVALVKLLAPSILLLFATVTTVVFATVNGSFAPTSPAGVGLLAWSGLLFLVLTFEILWGELRKKFVKSRWSRVAYYGLPGLMGGVFGARLSHVVLDNDLRALDKALLLTAFDPATLWVSLGVGLVFAMLAVALFVRRESYV